MKIAIDYTSAVHQGAGIGRLTRNVVRALAEIDRENRYTLLIQGRRRSAGVGCTCPSGTERRSPPRERNVASGIANDNFREVHTWINERWWTRIWHRLHLPIAAEWLIGQVDLFHGPDFVLPPLRSDTRAIVTVHDLSYLRLPHCFAPALFEYLVAHVPRAVRRADCVLADSQNTRQDVIELLCVPEAKVSVLYPGVESRFRPIRDTQLLERVRRKYDLPSRFILSVGTIQPRKNYGRLIEALGRLVVGGVCLVVVGGEGWLYEDIFVKVRDLHLEERVVFAGYVDDADLPAVYNLAEVFALPSLYEGFGIPPLEAMSCGIPVVTANNSSLPEVVGDAGLLVDADDIEAIADALARLLNDSALRQTLIERGLARAREFTWQRAAQTLRSTYERVGRA